MNLYEEKIDSYLTGKLSAADNSAFEGLMKSDPNLQSEVDFQKDIIESLKNSRKLQLKNRLNNIEVGGSTTSTGVSSAVKVAASVFTVGMIGAGVYYMSIFNTSNKEKENVEVVIDSNIKTSTATTTASSSTPLIAVPNVERTIALTDKAVDNVVITNKSNLITESPRNTDQVVNVQANVPNGVILETETDRINRDAIVALPDGLIGETSVGKVANVEVDINDSNKKEFSYKYFNNKLFLYGDFNEQPYNLFEINTPKSKQLYLLFDGKYYDLKANQSKITRLKEVKDQSVLKHLNK